MSNVLNENIYRKHRNEKQKPLYVTLLHNVRIFKHTLTHLALSLSSWCFSHAIA